eukprot:2059689-Ditylum_brightwellii.AAC.1
MQDEDAQIVLQTTRTNSPSCHQTILPMDDKGKTMRRNRSHALHQNGTNACHQQQVSQDLQNGLFHVMLPVPKER